MPDGAETGENGRARQARSGRQEDADMQVDHIRDFGKVAYFLIAAIITRGGIGAGFS
jgi:hypothetical protein